MGADGTRNDNSQKQRRNNTRDGIQNNHRDGRGRPRDCAPSARGSRIPKRRGATARRHIGVYIRCCGGIDTRQVTQKQLRGRRIDHGKDVDIRDCRIVDGVIAMVGLRTVQDHGGGTPAG